MARKGSAHGGGVGDGGAAPGGSQDQPVAQLGYAEASRELDAIVSFFEEREMDVDQLVVRLERATQIVDELDRRLRATRMQVEELVPRLTAAVRSRGAASESPAAVERERYRGSPRLRSDQVVDDPIIDEAAVEIEGAGSVDDGEDDGEADQEPDADADESLF
jgi:exonuclease VII small subunit